MIALSFVSFRETYAPLILSRRAAKLRKDTGDSRYYTVHERFEENKSLAKRLAYSLSRPMRLLIFHPIIQIQAAISGFQYGVLYIVLSSFAELWTSKYEYSVQLSGLHYIAIASGELAGSQLGGRFMDWLYARTQKHNHDTEAADSSAIVPESRIPAGIPGGIIAPLGLILYGWTAQYRQQWIAVDIGIFFACFGMQIATLPLQAYVIDAYPDHTSSALAAAQFARSLAAFLFPLFAPSMYHKMGYGWGNSLIAGARTIIGVPLMWVVYKWGKKLRANAKSSY